MHLVAPLAAGVKGAENGIAEIYTRGTVSPASYWLDFEATIPVITTGLVALDSHGGAIVYVQELCNIVVKDVGGAVLREFVAGVRDDSVEVQSPSFNGVVYGQASSAPGHPTTLGAILDLWVSANGGVDWRVGLPGGATATLQEAVAASYGLVFNVRAHGALGDGVANDTAAINAANAAAQSAGGGVVYFPPGIYRTTGGHAINPEVMWIGAGTLATSVVVDNPAASRLAAIGGSVDDRFAVVAHMRVAATVALVGPIFRFNSSSKAIFENLYLDGTNFASAIIQTSGSSSTCEMILDKCLFLLSSSAAAIATNTIRRHVLRDCRFITPALFTPAAVVSARPLEASGCVFVNTATATGTYSCFDQTGSGAVDMRVTDCKFLASAGATVTAMSFGAWSGTDAMLEVNNTFGAGVTAYSYSTTAGGRGANISLQTRETRAIFITDNTAAPNLPTDQYGLIVLSSNFNGAIVFQSSGRAPDGARGTIIVYRSGGTGTAQAGANFLNAAATVSFTTGAAYVWEYRACTPGATPRLALTVDGRSLGAGV